MRAEVPILLGVGGTVLRGSIDLLVERDGRRRWSSTTRPTASTAPSPAEHAARYETQRAIYALAVAESRGAPEVEVAYVFLERPDEPVLTRLGAAEMATGRERLAATIARIGGGEFPVAPVEQRDLAPLPAAARPWAASAPAPGRSGEAS